MADNTNAYALIEADDSVLVIIDVQDAFLDKMPRHESAVLLNKVRKAKLARRDRPARKVLPANPARPVNPVLTARMVKMASVISSVWNRTNAPAHHARCC